MREPTIRSRSAVTSADVRRAVGALVVLVLAVGQLSKSLVHAARPSGGGGVVGPAIAMLGVRGLAVKWLNARRSLS